MGNITKLIVLGLIENYKGEILISQRIDPNVKEANLKWDLIGGKNEYGESLEDTIIREAVEEADIKIKVIEMIPRSTSHIWKYDNRELHVIVLCFKCKLIEGNPKLGDHKIGKLKWVKKEDLKKYDFLPTTQNFIK